MVEKKPKMCYLCKQCRGLFQSHRTARIESDDNMLGQGVGPILFRGSHFDELHFCIFVFFVPPNNYLRTFLFLLFPPYGTRNSEPGSLSRLFSPLPTTAHAFVFFREKTPTLHNMPRCICTPLHLSCCCRGINGSHGVDSPCSIIQLT